MITSRLHTSHGTDYEFLRICRLWRVLSLKVVVFDGGEFYAVPPKTLHNSDYIV